MARRAQGRRYRDARKGAATVVSVLLCLVIVVTTLYVTKPASLGSSQRRAYDWTYTYHPWTHTGGSVVIGTGFPIHSLTPPILNVGLPDQVYRAVWNSCVVQLPDLKLGLVNGGWQPDQCTRVPTVANGDESPDEKTTTFHIDQNAVWSDREPLTADDFLFTFRLVRDPNVNATVWICQCSNVGPPWSLVHLTELDKRTVRIDWSERYSKYLTALAQLTPLPLHACARGPYAGVFDPATGTYNSKLAQRLAAEDNFNLHIPVDNGPFIVQGVEGYPFPVYQANVMKVTSTAQRLVLARNNRFFSNYFHKPVLDQVTFVTKWTSDPKLAPARTDAQIAAYRQGDLTVNDMVGLPFLSHLGNIPQSEVVTSPRPEIMTMGFNQRDVAPNARANGGVNLFADPTLRKAFVEAFDRCGAITAVYGLRNCNDPNFHTDEHAAPPSPDYDASFIMPAYNRADAAALLDQAGYPVVKDVRRFKDGTTPLRLFISLSYGGTAYLRLAQRLQQDDARNLHIDVQIENPPGQMFNPNVPVEKAPETTGAFDIGVWREAVGPDPADNLGGSGWVSANIPSVQNPDGANFLGLIDPWIVAQDQLARQALEDDQRVPVYKQMVRHVTEQLDFLPLLFDADTTLVKPTLCNFTKWPADGGYLWNMADWYLARGPTCP